MDALIPDHAGTFYQTTLASLHQVLAPRTYFEVGTLNGDTLALARCPSIAVDPQFMFNKPELIERIVAKPRLMLFQMGSDAFFAAHDPERLLGAKLDFAFLDGMHRCEFLLRDFANTERYCKPNSIVALHDCLPVEPFMAERTPSAREAASPHRQGWWTGDVWRFALLLKRVRRDLVITALNAPPTGLVLVTNLDPQSRLLTRDYADHVRTMLSWDLEALGIETLFAELEVESTSALQSEEQITARFWL